MKYGNAETKYHNKKFGTAMMYLTVSTNSTDGWNSYSYSGLVKSPTCGGRSNTNLCLPRENLINTVSMADFGNAAKS